VPLSAILEAANHQLGGDATIKARANFPELRDRLAELAKQAAKAVHAALKDVKTYTISGHVDTSGFKTNWHTEYGVGVVDAPHLRCTLSVWVFFEDQKYKIHVGPPEGGPARVQFDTSVFEPTIPSDFGKRASRALAEDFAELLRLK
jgi:hypothetical protein